MYFCVWVGFLKWVTLKYLVCTKQIDDTKLYSVSCPRRNYCSETKIYAF